MKANVNLFWILFVFFAISAAAYTVWAIIVDGEVEWVGTVTLSLSGILGAFVGFYLGRVHNAQGGALPEDRLDANIDDGDAELGFFSPWSWWPIMLAGSASLFVLGLAVGFWICFIALAFVLISLVGWTYEYYRGLFAR